MAEGIVDCDSEGVYVGMSLDDFGVRVSQRRGSGSTSTRTSSATKTAASNPGENEFMPRDQLRESIAHLREELSDGEPLTAEDRSQLETVLGEVSGLLASEESEDSDGEDDGFDFSDLSSLVERFEATHPKVAVVLGRIADSLAQLGI